MVALVTPMLDNGDLDYPALDQLIEWHIEAGTSAIIAVGTTGESATVSINEHCELIKHVVERVAGRIAVIAGTGANATEEAIKLTEAAKDASADACLTVTPYYNKPTQEGLYQHHKAIAEAVDIPNILYNVPGRTAVDMTVETTLRLAQIPNIVGIKDATGDMQRAKELLAQCPSDFAIYSGDDETATELMMMGGKGSISVTANVNPAAIADLCQQAMRVVESVDAPSEESIRAANQALMPLHHAMFVESNPIPVKWALFKMGRITKGIRLPLTPLSEAYQDQVSKAVDAHC